MTELETMEDFIFEGFDKPSENWSKLPHVFMNFLPRIMSLSELKVVLYILRHTWGFQEFDNPRRITVDEFMHGRKLKDGSRIDDGTGMSEPSIRDGLKRAEKHGFITIDVNDIDKARVEKSYQLNMNQGERSLPPGGKKFTPRGKEVLPRSEKDTSKETKKQSISSGDDVQSNSTPQPKAKTPRPANPVFDAVALGSWGLSNVNGDKTVGAMIGKIVKWLKEHDAEITAERITEFYEWYADENENTSAPRDVGKFGGWWLKFEAQADEQFGGSDPFAKTFEGVY
jgi:hypothetical protein